jgi:hypothetical protein
MQSTQPVLRSDAMLDVFLSHKEKDSQVAAKIKECLKDKFHANVFLSSDAKDLRGGDNWLDALHAKLEEARWLVLLYSDAGQNWDWCIYEGGFFRGHHIDSRNDNLAVLHPRGTSPPAPFKAIQAVEAGVDPVAGWLRKAFHNRTKNGSFSERSYLGAAHTICRLVQQLATRPYAEQRIVKVHVESGKKDGSLSVSEMFKAATLTAADLLAANVLETVPDQEITGEQLRELFEKRSFDTIGLCDMINRIRERGLPPAVLELFCAPGGQGYRPVVTKANRSDGGIVDIELTLASIPPTFKFDTAIEFDRLFQLLAATARFRSEVTEAFANKLASAKSLPAAKQKELLLNLERARDQVLNDARTWGMTSSEVRSPFGVAVQHRVTDAQDSAREALALLDKAVRDKDIALANNAFAVLRYANYEFLDLVVNRLLELLKAQALPPIQKGWIKFLPEHVQARAVPAPSSRPRPRQNRKKNTAQRKNARRRMRRRVGA